MMDAELVRLSEFPRFIGPVRFLLDPLLSAPRDIAPMPCKHGRTFDLARQARSEYFESIGAEDPGDDEAMQMPKGYCDCGPFNRRNELWEIAEMCVKRSLTAKQMTEIAALIVVLTKETFTYNHFHHAMLDLFGGEHKDFLKAFKRQRDKGASFAEAMPGLVARWQWRMMPNV